MNRPRNNNAARFLSSANAKSLKSIESEGTGYYIKKGVK
jgi:hypothetical protein